MMAQTLPSFQNPGASLPSPTLTNPDMILPNRHGGHYRNGSLSSLPDHELPPSPSHLRLRAGPRSSQAQEHRRQRLSREILRDSDAEIGASNPSRRLNAKASAPALKTQDSFEMAKKRLSMERKWSDGSAESINSEVLRQMRWPSQHASESIDGGNSEDDEYDEGGIAEFIGRNSKITGDDVAEEDHSGNEDDPYSSMSRRAELILANAKKRLNLMEGNLRGARTSLKSPAPYSFNQSSPDSTSSPTFAKSFHEGRIHSSLGFSPAQNHSGRVRTSSVLHNGSPSHGRNFSDSHAPIRSLSLSNRPSKREQQPSAGRNGVAPSFLQSRSLRGTRSADVLGDSKSLHHPLRKPSLDWSSPTGLDTLPEDDNVGRINGARSTSQQSIRSTSSTTSELRNQMHLLKGRLSTLRERTIEDNIRRRSMQNARIPSPFTDAEAWYTGADSYKGQPLNTDAGVGYSPTERVSEDEFLKSSHHPVASLDPSLDEGSTPNPRYSNPYSSLPIDPRLGGQISQPQSNINVEEKELASDVMTPREEVDERDASIAGESTYEDADEGIVNTEDHSTPTGEDEHFKSSYFDHYDRDAEEPRTATRGTFKFDQDEPNENGRGPSASGRHEDRADAFDYEHFFLHSSMGSMSNSRRSSQSSAGSVETTKGPTTETQPEEQGSGAAPLSPPAAHVNGLRVQHQRSESASSVSTMATFATATEGNATPADEREEEDVLPTMTNDLRISSNHPFNNSTLPIPIPSPQGRPDSGVGIQTRDATGQQSSPNINGSQGRADSVVTANPRHRSTSGSHSASSSLQARSHSSPKPWVAPVVTPVVNSLLTSTRPAIKLEKRDEINLRIFMESLREVCLRLSEGGEDESETREWRRRLEEARRVLDGRSRPRI
ncbi:MAG: hypothetical protein Q9157_007287 [Trypethelium eluteriae]